jgi:hypothetical protein
MKKRFIAIISLVVVLVAVILTVVIVDNKKEIYISPLNTSTIFKRIK